MLVLLQCTLFLFFLIHVEGEGEGKGGEVALTCLEAESFIRA